MEYRPSLKPIVAAVAALFDSPRPAADVSRLDPKCRTAPLFVGAALACIALAPPVAHAQAPAPPEATLPEVKVREQPASDEYAPGVSTTGAKVPAPVRDIPQSITIINRPLIEAQSAASLVEALRYVPGITISAGEGGQIGDNINLRGFSARTDLFLDGIRDRGQARRDTFFLDSIEVLKGPSSMLFGRGSTGGVINQVTKRPTLTPLAEASVTLGTDNYRRATLDVNRPFSDTSALRVSALAHDADSTRDEIEAKRIGIAPSLRFGIGTPTEVRLSALVEQNRELPDYGFPVVAVNGPGSVRKPLNAPANRFYNYLDDHFDQDIGFFGATIEHKVNSRLTLRNQTQFSRNTTDARPTPLGAVTVIGGGTASQTLPLERMEAARQDRDRKVTDSSLVNQTDLIARIETGGVRHTLTAGIELGIDKSDTDRNTWVPTNVPINLGNPVNGTRPGAPFRSQKTDTSADSIAAYVNDQADIGKRWKIVGGLRWDRFNADTTQVNYNASGVVISTTALSKLDRMLSTRAGVIYQPTDFQSYYAAYGTSFNPSAEAISQNATTANLDPEKNRSYEVGAKWDLLNGNALLNAALFRIEKTNARTPDPLTGVQVLAGEVRVDGAEVGVVGRITPAWQVFGGYTFLDGEIVKSGQIGTGADAGIPAESKTFPNTPRHSASLWSTYRFAGAWEAGAGVVYVSKRYLNNFETALTDGYTRADATLAYLQPRYDVRLNLLNVTDKVYFDTANAGRAVPAEGRKVLLTFTYRM
jgi:catecholate siderophore receptor